MRAKVLDEIGDGCAAVGHCASFAPPGQEEDKGNSLHGFRSVTPLPADSGRRVGLRSTRGYIPSSIRDEIRSSGTITHSLALRDL